MELLRVSLGSVTTAISPLAEELQNLQGLQKVKLTHLLYGHRKADFLLNERLEWMEGHLDAFEDNIILWMTI